MAEVEEMDRGWYAGPVGWMDGSGDGEFCVALRSALIRDREAHLYAGVDVVADSDRASELADRQSLVSPDKLWLGGKPGLRREIGRLMQPRSGTDSRSALVRFYISLSILTLAIVSIIVFPSGAAIASPGELDDSFSGDGVVSGGSNYCAGSLGVQTDDKSVVVCDGSLFRFLADGSVDSGFGSSGVASLDIPGFFATALTFDSSGRIIVVGIRDLLPNDYENHYDEFMVARYLPNGDLDTSFGGGSGFATAAMSGADEVASVSVSSVAIDNSGRIVVGGGRYYKHVYEWGHNWETVMAMARFTSGGALDSNFGDGGVLIGSERAVRGLAVQSDGKLIVGLRGFDPGGFTLIRLLDGGTFDVSFGTGGVVRHFDTNTMLSDIALQPDGKIVASGSAGENGLIVARFNADGSRDSSFGYLRGLTIVRDLNKQDEYTFGSKIAIQPDGRLIVIGGSADLMGAVDPGLMVARFDPNGWPDLVFGADGVSYFSPPGAGWGIGLRSVGIQSSGRILASGYLSNGSTGFTLIGVKGGGEPVPSTPPREVLQVTVSGAGEGSVSEQISALGCSVEYQDFCGAQFDRGTTVTLTASPWWGSYFQGWSGACSGTGDCVLTMNEAKSVGAIFTEDSVANYSVNVTKLGDGQGSIASSPFGIDCGDDCSSEYAEGSEVTLTATASQGSSFTGWSGACTGLGACHVTLNGDKQVSATFSKDPVVPPVLRHQLSVAKSGPGSGLVSSSPAGIDCGVDCSNEYDQSSLVTLTAIPASGSEFDGWSGSCSGTGSTCQVTMTESKSVSATFVVKAGIALPPAGKPEFGPLIVKPKPKVLKRGKRTVISALVENTGEADATGVEVCVKAPRASVTGSSCHTIGKLAAGASKSVKFKLSASKKAKKGKRVSLVFKAGGLGMAPKTVKVTVSIT